jgi:hypothetical protein
MTDKILEVANRHLRLEIETAIRKRDELRAENERLREEMAEWESAHAAVTELRGLVESHMDRARGEWECVATIERLRAAILAYDDAIRKASWRGQRVIDDDEQLDELYAEMLLAAGREPEAT